MIEETFTPGITPKVQEIYNYVQKTHKGQKRELTREDYIDHLTSVAEILMNEGATETTIILALLKDTLKVTPLGLDRFEEEFGLELADCIAELSGYIPLAECQYQSTIAIKIAEYVDLINKVNFTQIDGNEAYRIDGEIRAFLRELSHVTPPKDEQLVPYMTERLEKTFNNL